MIIATAQPELYRRERKERGWCCDIARAQPELCKHGSMSQRGVTVFMMGYRECSARALQARRDVRARVSQRVSRSFVAVQRVAPCILLEAAGCSCLFLAQPHLDGRRSSMVKVQHSEVQDQPERCRGQSARVFDERLGRNVANTGKRCMCDAKGASTSEAVGVNRRRYWAYRSELKHLQGRHSSTLRASEVQGQMWQKAKWRAGDSCGRC